jgi:lipopolysaccharide biosynthesis glycosyltransferase
VTKSKLAVCTLSIGDESEGFAHYSIPTFQKYASKMGADLIVFDQKKVNYTSCTTIDPVKFEKYQLYDVLENYERALYVDIDILISPFAPNIFEKVPLRQVGGRFEDVAMNKENRQQIIHRVQEVLGDIGWTTGYMNSGMMVVSKCHRDVFKMIYQYGICDEKYEQNNTNWYIRKAGFKIKNLGYKWNFMGFDRILHGPIHRKAYFIHYAGKGIFLGVPRVDQMKEDYAFFYGELSN